MCCNFPVRRGILQEIQKIVALSVWQSSKGTSQFRHVCLSVCPYILRWRNKTAAASFLRRDVLQFRNICKHFQTFIYNRIIIIITDIVHENIRVFLCMSRVKALNIFRCQQSIKYVVCRNINTLYYFLTLYNNSISLTSCEKSNKIGGHDRIMQLCLRLNL